MRSSAIQWMLLTGLALAWFPGCGGSSGDKGASNVKEPKGEAESAKNEIKHYDATDLPPVDEPLQRPLDGGRLAICPPADWGFFSQANYLVVFAKGRVSELPRITVAAVDSPHGPAETTDENAAALSENVLRKLKKDKKIVRENPKPVKLGGRVWVRHVRQVTQGGTPCAVQSLQTVCDGRLYTLEAFSAAKDDSQASIAAAVRDVRDLAYAVAANARFTKGGASSGTSPATEEKKPEKAPAEEKPAGKPAEKPAEAKPEEKKSG